MNDVPDQAETERLEAWVNEQTLPPTLGQFVADNAERYADQVALNYFLDEVTLSYRELHEKADQLAAGLSSLGLRKGAHVSVMLPNVPETFVTWVALARIGAVMIPTNVNYTATELSFVLNDADVQLMIVHADFLDTVAQAERPDMLSDSQLVVVADSIEGMNDWHALVADHARGFVAPTPVRESDLLNIQYTSGTTGFPKGCMLTHDYWMHAAFSLGGSWGERGEIRKTLAWPPFFYMDGLWQVLGTFLHGGTAFVPRRMSMSRFVDWLEHYDIECCTFPEVVLKSFEASERDNALSLKYIYSFGWRPESKELAEQRFNCHALDAYGMTELGTATITPKGAASKSYRRTCGRHAPNRELKILDDQGREVADGERGELWVRGRGVMWGYYKRPQANAEVFRDDWFRTGDIFYRDEEGYYFIVGRIKDMVKRAGENIAAREVEAVLHELDGINEAAIVPVPDPVRKEEVKVYLILSAGWSPEDLPPQAILEHCQKHLARFKHPRYFAYIEELPRTPSRKVAKDRLIKGGEDLRIGAYDAVEEAWR